MSVQKSLLQDIGFCAAIKNPNALNGQATTTAIGGEICSSYTIILRIINIMLNKIEARKAAFLSGDDH